VTYARIDGHRPLRLLNHGRSNCKNSMAYSSSRLLRRPLRSFENQKNNRPITMKQAALLALLSLFASAAAFAPACRCVVFSRWFLLRCVLAALVFRAARGSRERAPRGSAVRARSGARFP
jgi:hypothetical protein